MELETLGGAAAAWRTARRRAYEVILVVHIHNLSLFLFSFFHFLN